MSIGAGSDDRWLSRLTDYLQNERYHPHIVTRWTAVARHFVWYLGDRGTHVEDAQPSDVTGYLRREHRRYVRRHHHRPASINGWRNSHTGGIHMLLRFGAGIVAAAESVDGIGALPRNPHRRVRPVDAGPSWARGRDVPRPL